MAAANLTGYDLSRAWFEFTMENPEKINPNHSALFFFAIELCNRLGWPSKFSMPTGHAMQAIGIKSYNTYIKAFNELVEFGFFKLVEKSKNQYTANIIELSKFNKAPDKAQVKANELSYQNLTKQVGSTQQSNYSINKPLKHNKPKTVVHSFTFEDFWNVYPRKENKKKAAAIYSKLSEKDVCQIRDTLTAFLAKNSEIKFLPHATTYLNGERWNDDLNATSTFQSKNTTSIGNAIL